MSILPMRSVPPVDSDVVRFFDKHRLFDSLTQQDRITVAAHAHPRKYSRRQTVWRPGDEASSVLVVRSGVVRESQVTPNDRELTLHLHGRRAVFGEESLQEAGIRHTRAVAHEDVTIYAIHREHLLPVLEAYPHVAMGLVQSSTKRRINLDQRLAAVAYMTARSRVASVLLELAKSFGVQDSRGTIVNVRLTHREMAALIGATRETVSFAILAFRRSGVIETEQKRVVILDQDALEREALEAAPSR